MINLNDPTELTKRFFQLSIYKPNSYKFSRHKSNTFNIYGFTVKYYPSILTKEFYKKDLPILDSSKVLKSWGLIKTVHEFDGKTGRKLYVLVKLSLGHVEGRSLSRKENLLNWRFLTYITILPNIFIWSVQKASFLTGFRGDEWIFLRKRENQTPYYLSRVKN